MTKRDLKKLSKSELIKLLLNKSKKVHNHENLHDDDPFKDEHSSPMNEVHDELPPLDESNTNIRELKKALKNHAKSYEIEIQSNSNPLAQFIKTKELVESHLDNILKTMKGFKFIETLVVTFEKLKIENEKPVSIYRTAFFNSKAKTITKVDDIEPKLRMSRDEIHDKIDKWISEGSGWIIDRINSHYINITPYKPLNGSSYVELQTELLNSAKGLINMKNEDDECFRWCHIRHLNPQIKHPERIKKDDKGSIEGLNYDGIAFPVTQKQYNKIETQNSIAINVFGYESRQPFPIYISSSATWTVSIRQPH